MKKADVCRTCELDESKGSVSNTLKAFSKTDDLYIGSTLDNFDWKFALLIECSNWKDLKQCQNCRVFSIMLSNAARRFIFDELQAADMSLKRNGLVYSRAVRNSRRHTCIAPGTVVCLTILAVPKNRGNSRLDCAEISVNRLLNLHGLLPEEYHSRALLWEKSVNAANNVNECRLAYLKRVDTVAGVISDWRSPLSAVTIDTNEEETSVEAFFTNRKIHERAKQWETQSERREKKCFV